MNPLFFLFALLAMGGSSGGGGGARTSEESFVSMLPEEDIDPVEDDDTPPPVEQNDLPGQVADESPEAPEQSGDSDEGGQTDPIVISGGTTEVVAGRVATLEANAEDVQSLKIISDVEHGTVTVNPDNTFALVLTKSDFVGSQNFIYEAIHSDGSVTQHEVSLDVVPGEQAGGWGTSESHYMLETDADGRVVVEHGDNHVKVFVSGSDSALSLEDIARLEGMSVDQITGAWLANHGGYGQSEGMALAEDAGGLLWNAVTKPGSETSNWLLFERGYQYGEFNENWDATHQRILQADTHGESELNPLYIGAWGEGDRPEITNKFSQLQESSSNVVIQDLHFSGGIRWLGGENIIFDHVTFTQNKASIQGADGVTIRNADFYDIYFEESLDGGDWDAHGDRTAGIYSNNVDGFLLEHAFFTQIGWEEGFDPDGSGDSPQAPSQYSQNIYLSFDMTDVTVRDTITMQAASFGAQVRSGGYIEDVAFIDNNAAFITVGGNTGDEQFDGQYTFMADTLITSAAYKEAVQIGAKSSGLVDRGEMSTLVDNIVAHLSDPNDPSELDYKLYTGPSVESENGSYYDDTLVWNWVGSRPSGDAVTEQNVEGLDSDVLDQTTIQLFTAQLLGDPNATINDLADYLRAEANGAFDDLVDADMIIQFFQEGFGLSPDLRETETTLRFVPSDLAEGVRWDNRLNWDTEDLPGTQDGDSVDLGGNYVAFGTNAEIDEMALSDGTLNVYGGRLDVTGGITDGGLLNIEGAGQAWVAGHTGDDTLDIDMSGGRLVNTGDMANTDLTVDGGQAILASDGAEFDVSSGRTLAIFDAAAKVGFDGDDGGMAILDLDSEATLSIGSSDGEIASIEEFRSGAFGDAPNVQSGIDLGGATLEINLDGLSASQAGTFTLMDADEIVGIVDAATLSIGGLGGRDANLVIDYVNDTVALELIEGGTGAIDVVTLGDQRQSDHDALWQALTADQGLAENQPLPEDEELLDSVA